MKPLHTMKSPNFLGYREKDELRLVRLQNPTGCEEWDGDYSDKSPKWANVSPETKAALGVKDGTLAENDTADGEFWMTFDDFCRHFDLIAVCRYVYNSLIGSLITGGAANWSEERFKDKWTEETSGGYFGEPGFFKNPQVPGYL